MVIRQRSGPWWLREIRGLFPFVGAGFDPQVAVIKCCVYPVGGYCTGVPMVTTEAPLTVVVLLKGPAHLSVFQSWGVAGSRRW